MLSGEAIFSNLFFLPSVKRSFLKGKNLLPMGGSSFILECTTLKKGLGAWESKQEVTKIVSFVKYGQT